MANQPPADEPRYAGVVWKPSQSWIRACGHPDYNREALRELLPYIAQGWAPEYIIGNGLYCGARAFARSLANVVWNCTKSQVPIECSFHALLTLLLSDDYKNGWRHVQQQVVLARNPNDIPTFEERGNFFEVDDFRYLLGYINQQGFLPIKLRLGIIAELRATPGGIRKGDQLTSIHICDSLEARNEPYPVMWLHNVENWHWQSIGPRPSYDGLALVSIWGLFNAAAAVVRQGLYRVTPESKQKTVDRTKKEESLLMLQLGDYDWVYRHPTNETSTGEKCFLGLTPRSALHDGRVLMARPNIKDTQLEGYCHEDSVVQVTEFASPMDTKTGKTRIGRTRGKLRMKNPKTGTVGRIYQPSEDDEDSLDGINVEYDPEYLAKVPTSSTKASSSQKPSSPPKTSPPAADAPARSPPKTPKRSAPIDDDPDAGKGQSSSKKPSSPLKTSPPAADAPARSPPKTPKRSAPIDDDPDAGKGQSSSKKPRTDNSSGAKTFEGFVSKPAATAKPDTRAKPNTAITPAIIANRPITATYGNAASSNIQLPIFESRSASNVRMFRAKHDSRILSHGFFTDALIYRPNDLVVAIEPIPERPFAPFWARTQDHREGLVAPGNLEEFLPKAPGESYLPFGLCNEDVVTPVPFLHSTYLTKGEPYVTSLRKHCGVDPDAVYQNGAIKQIIEFRRREGVPMAFWKGIDATEPKDAHAIMERYVRMVNHNSKNFQQDTDRGQAEVWLQDTSLGPRLATKDQLVYHHDMNWGLRLRRRKTPHDLNAPDSKIGADRILLPHFKVNPYTYPPLTLNQRFKKFIFGKDGYDSKLTFDQKVDVDWFNHNKVRSFDNENREAREVVAVESQNPRPVRTMDNRTVKLLEFMKGDRIWMEAPIGVPPYHGWNGCLIHGGHRSPIQGFVYPGKVRDLRPSEQPTSQVQESIRQFGHFTKEMETIKSGKKLEPPEGAWLEGRIDPAKGPNEGQWMGGGRKKKRPNSGVQLKAILEYEEDTHKKLSASLEGAGVKEYIEDEKKKHQTKVDQLTEFSTWVDSKKGIEEALSQPDLLALLKKSPVKVDKTTEDVITKWLATPEGCKTPFHVEFDDPSTGPANIIDPDNMPPTPTPGPRFPTTQPIKPLIDRTPGAYRRPKNGKLMGVKDLRRMQTVYYEKPQGPPKMGPLTDDGGKEKKKRDGENKKQASTEKKAGSDGSSLPVAVEKTKETWSAKRKATGDQGGSPSKTRKEVRFS